MDLFICHFLFVGYDSLLFADALKFVENGVSSLLLSSAISFLIYLLIKSY